jgi:hypothetical protein
MRFHAYCHIVIQRFCQAASIGTIGDVNLSSIFSVYTNVVSELVTESYEDALGELEP